MHFSRFILPFLAAVAIAQDGDDNDPSNDDDNDAVGAASTAVANGGMRASMFLFPASVPTAFRSAFQSILEKKNKRKTNLMDQNSQRCRRSRRLRHE